GGGGDERLGGEGGEARAGMAAVPGEGRSGAAAAGARSMTTSVANAGEERGLPRAASPGRAGGPAPFPDGAGENETDRRGGKGRDQPSQAVGAGRGADGSDLWRGGAGAGDHVLGDAQRSGHYPRAVAGAEDAGVLRGDGHPGALRNR